MKLGGALLVVFALTAGPSTASVRAGPGKLGFDPAMGAAVPAQGSRTDVSLTCSAKCKGSLRLVYAGTSIASKSFTITGGGTISLVLNSAGRAALASHPLLPVTLALNAAGRPAVKRSISIGSETAFQASATPKSVKVQHPPRGQGTGTVKIYDWSWSIPPGLYLVLPSWKCPGDAPWVQAGGRASKNGRKAKAVAEASSGVGYSRFAKTYTKKIGPRWYLTGWKQGDFWSNSVWTPPHASGTFDLKVTCTDSADEAAYATSNGATSRLFPWNPA